MDVNLTPEIEAILQAKVATGEYPSLAALIEEALFLLVERDWQSAQRDLLKRAPGVLDTHDPSTPTPEASGDR